MVLDFYCLNKACFLSVTLAELAASTGLPHTPNSTLRFLHLCNSTASFAPSAANICLRRNCFYKKKSVQSAFGSFKASCFKYYLSLAHHPPAPLPHINTLTYISPPPIPPNHPTNHIYHAVILPISPLTPPCYLHRRSGYLHAC